MQSIWLVFIYLFFLQGQAAYSELQEVRGEERATSYQLPRAGVIVLPRSRVKHIGSTSDWFRESATLSIKKTTGSSLSPRQIQI